MRLFVAFDIPDNVVTVLSQAQKQLRQEIQADRWQPMHNLHLTLHFLGEVNESLLPSICEDMNIVSSIIQPFTLVLGSFGAFPSIERPRVLWVGLEGNRKALVQTHQLLGKRFDLHPGLSYDSREYKPHITLARSPRFSQGVMPVQEWNEKFLPETPVRWQVSQINLYRSELRPEGAVHTIIHTAELAQKILS
ncbi:RNA 2',3'-cyclic phosphodiesterase [Brevibacillus sp. SYSU BS000544]|uniref:RNA 2',3'-cyclic phosphodiesterase n=1 Tax=Brevibacillus sp. SYSU BS000544 TaxID=3416443 RepID=UPI003CE58A20